MAGRFLQSVGVLVALASIVLGIYVQTGRVFGTGTDDFHIRALYAMEALTPMTLGFLLAAAGQLLDARESQPN